MSQQIYIGTWDRYSDDLQAICEAAAEALFPHARRTQAAAVTDRRNSAALAMEAALTQIAESQHEARKAIDAKYARRQRSTPVLAIDLDPHDPTQRSLLLQATHDSIGVEFFDDDEASSVILSANDCGASFELRLTPAMKDDVVTALGHVGAEFEAVFMPYEPKRRPRLFSRFRPGHNS